MSFKQFEQQKIMGIIRGDIYNVISPLFNAIYKSGLKTIEITMNSPRAEECIKKSVFEFGSKLWIGAGTVLTMQDMDNALNAGAKFIVMPVCIKEIVKYCVDNNIPVFPGAFTPQEVFNAWDMGASMVKLFPAKFFGAEYIKELKAPLNKIKILACGGVKPSNINTFFEYGADAAAFGGSIFKRELLENKDFTQIEKNIALFI